MGLAFRGMWLVGGAGEFGVDAAFDDTTTFRWSTTCCIRPPVRCIGRSIREMFSPANEREIQYTTDHLLTRQMVESPAFFQQGICGTRTASRTHVA